MALLTRRHKNYNSGTPGVKQAARNRPFSGSKWFLELFVRGILLCRARVQYNVIGEFPIRKNNLK